MILSQTKATLVLQNIQPAAVKKCATDADYIAFIHNLCKAYFFT